MPAEIIQLTPVNAQPQHSTVLATDPDEQLARIDGIEAVRRLCERFGTQTVKLWLSYAQQEGL